VGIKKAFTDGIRRLAGDGTAQAPEIRLAYEIIQLWQDEIERWNAGDLAAQPRSLQERTAELGRRVASLPESPPKTQLVRELVANAGELITARQERERIRQASVSEGTRNYQRSAQQHELKHHHLLDEIARCRDLIIQEYRRRSLNLPAGHENCDLHEQLFQLLKAISHLGSQRMQTVTNDPLLVELEALLSSEDPTAIERFPEWLRKPAAKLLAVVQERNRYKRLLINSGLLPTDG